MPESAVKPVQKRRHEAHFVSKLSRLRLERTAKRQSSLRFREATDGYMTAEQHQELAAQSREVGKMLGRMINNPRPFLTSGLCSLLSLQAQQAPAYMKGSAEYGPMTFCFWLARP